MWQHDSGIASQVLLGELFGPLNPIVAWMPLLAGRLQLQCACRDACYSVQRCAEEMARAAHCRYPDLKFELLCAAGEIEFIWALLVSSGSPRDQLHAYHEVGHGHPVHFALAGHHRQTIALLRSYGAEVPEVPKRTPSHDALLAASNGDVPTVLKLLAAGLDINTTYTFGWTMLMSAAGANQVWTVEVLLTLGALPNAITNTGKRAWDLAQLSGHEDVLKILNEWRHKKFSLPDLYDGCIC